MKKEHVQSSESSYGGEEFSDYLPSPEKNKTSTSSMNITRRVH